MVEGEDAASTASSALVFYADVLTTFVNQLRTEDLLKMMHSLGMTYTVLGIYDRALEMQESTLAMFRRILPEDWRTAAAMKAASAGLAIGLPARWPQIDGIGLSSASRRCARSSRLSSTWK